jgi:hypothetical protein
MGITLAEIFKHCRSLSAVFAVNDGWHARSALLRIDAAQREDLAMKTSSKSSRREFVCAGTGAMAATIAAATSPARATTPQAHVQAPPPAATAPRILRKPPLTELQRIARSYDLVLSQDDLTSFRGLMDGVLASYRRLDQFAEPTLPVKYQRDTGYRPAAAENRLNAWYWKCSIKGAQSGPGGQKDCHQGQHLRRRHPDDERYQRAGRLCTGR